MANDNGRKLEEHDSTPAIYAARSRMANDNGKKLEEHPGSKCPKCEVVFFGEVDKCQQCEGPTEPTKWYSRFCVERLAFIATVAVLSGIAALVAGKDGGTVLGVFFGVGFMTFSMYFTANYFLGIGGFTERFAEGAVPPRAPLAFSWGRYFLEIFRSLGVFIALFLFVGLCMLLKWAFTGEC